MQTNLIVNNVKHLYILEIRSTKRENKSIKEKWHMNRSSETLSKANIYLIVYFRAINFDWRRNRLLKMQYKSEISYIPDRQQCFHEVEEIRSPKTNNNGHARLLTRTRRN